MTRNPAGQAMVNNKNTISKTDNTLTGKQPIKLSNTGNPQTTVSFSNDVKLLKPDTYSNTHNPQAIIKPTTVVLSLLMPKTHIPTEHHYLRNGLLLRYLQWFNLRNHRAILELAQMALLPNLPSHG